MSTERLLEGYSTNRPPLFDGKFYAYWKSRMEIFIKAHNYRCWLIIVNGDLKVTKTNSEGLEIDKPTDEYTRQDYETIELNYIAMQTLMCGLGPNEHNRVMGCKSAKQIWNLLEVTHEGTNEVKRSKIDLLTRQYELFEMLPDESVNVMITRFTNIVNELDSLGRSIENEEQVRKILRILPKSWMPLVTALKESKDFTKFSLEELIGSLMTHEIEVQSHERHPRRDKGLALQAEESDDESDEEDVAMLARKFKKFYKAYKGTKRQGKSGFKSKTNDGCFECGSTDHLVKDCPKRKRQPYKKSFNSKKAQKAMVAAWGDSDEESEPEEEAHICLIADNTEKVSESKADHLSTEPCTRPGSKGTRTDTAADQICLMANDDQVSDSEYETDQADSEVTLDNLMASVPLMSKSMLEDVLKDLSTDYLEVCDANKQLEIDLETKSEMLITAEASTASALLKLDDCMKAKAELEQKNQDLVSEINRLKQANVGTRSKATGTRPDRNVKNSSARTGKNRPVRTRPEKPSTRTGWLKVKDNVEKHGLGFIEHHSSMYRRRPQPKKKRGFLPSDRLCYRCGMQGHIQFECRKSNDSFAKFSYATQMSHATNRSYVKRQGPKQIWVPKIRN
jgi:gag-polypeptide of LTR copia-type/Zinc knuckle